MAVIDKNDSDENYGYSALSQAPAPLQKAALGKRRCARLKSGARALKNPEFRDGNCIMFNIRRIDERHWCRCGKPRSQSGLRHAYRTYIVRMSRISVVVSVRRNRGKQNAAQGFRTTEVFQMKVTEPDRKINCERKQRQRRNPLHFGAEPLHSVIIRTSGSGCQLTRGKLSNFFKQSIVLIFI